jgi:heme ABC exporter ATP-binding subunit CcmA
MMTHQSSAIQTQRLSKSLGGRMVLREIDLTIATGECVALTGSNGAGKTTLLRCLAASARPTAGAVHWFGRPAAASPDHRRLVGIVAHETRLYAHLTLRENLLFAARMCAVTEPTRRADKLLEQIGLRSLADRQVRQISKGMRQRLALARALIHEPPIMLLDEPFSGLDAASRDWLAEQLHERRAGGCAVCFSTHDEQQTRQFADRTLILRNGSLAGRTLLQDQIGTRQHDIADASAEDNTRRYAA